MGRGGASYTGPYVILSIHIVVITQKSSRGQQKLRTIALKQVHSSNNLCNLQAYANIVLHKRYGYCEHFYTGCSKNPKNGETSCNHIPFLAFQLDFGLVSLLF